MTDSDKDDIIKYYQLLEIALRSEITVLRLLQMDQSDLAKKVAEQMSTHYAKAQAQEICCDMSEMLKK